MLRIFLFFILMSMVLSLSSQETDQPKQELRAVWLTTVSNLDWPNKDDRGDTIAQKEHLVNLLDSMQSIKLNTIFFQVRTECDAFYNSDYEPWSRYITGTQGVDPGYDPLAFAIKEAHDRGLELHVWMNPYRINASNNDSGNYYSEDHVFYNHPEWILTYPDGRKILNPGLPAVQKYIQNVVGDLISKYDVDGVHFDDYFYSYSGTNSSLDLLSFEENKLSGEVIGDFRRRSINQMVANVSDTLNSVKPYIRFGISPFGIYGSNINPPGIIGLDAYNTIYCDPLAWLDQGTVDYINPQLYWPTGGNQDYATLLPWWAEQVEERGRHIYSGHGIYRLDTDPSLSKFPGISEVNNIELNLSFVEEIEFVRNQDPWNLDQVGRQISITRSEREKGALGSVFFRANDFERVQGLKEYLRANTYSSYSLWPEMDWKDGVIPEPPTELTFTKNEIEGNFELAWSHSDPSVRFVIYNAKTLDPSTDLAAENILGVSYSRRFSPRTFPEGEISEVYVTALDREGRESTNSTLFKIPEPGNIDLIQPIQNNDLVTNEDLFVWNSTENSAFYEITVSLDSGFEEIVGKYEVRDTTFPVETLDLNGETSYFWKVTGLSFAGRGNGSDVWSFTTAFPRLPEIIYPSNLEVDVPLVPEISYMSSDKVDSVTFQISEGGTKFETFRIILDTIVSTSSQNYQLLDQLKSNTTHYLRYKAKNQYGETKWSSIVQFKTLQPLPDMGVVIEPGNDELFMNSVTNVNILWNELGLANSYKLQVSANSDFENLILDKTVFNDTSYTFSDLTMNSWHYVRVAGVNIGGTGEWSEGNRFGLGTISAVEDIEMEESLNIYPNPSIDGRYQLKLDFGQDSDIEITLYDYLGKLIKVDKFLNNGGGMIYHLDYSRFTCNPCLIQVRSYDSGIIRNGRILHFH